MQPMRRARLLLLAGALHDPGGPLMQMDQEVYRDSDRPDLGELQTQFEPVIRKPWTDPSTFTAFKT